MILKISKEAKRKLKEIQSNIADDQKNCLRLTLTPLGELSLVLARGMTTDTITEYHKGTKILVVDSYIAELLDKSVLDVQDTPDGQKLVLYREA